MNDMLPEDILAIEWELYYEWILTEPPVLRES